MGKSEKEQQATTMMIALDYARTHKPAEVAAKYGTTTNRVRAIWRGLSDEEKERLRADARGIREEVREVILAEQANIVHDTTAELSELLGLTLREYRRRLKEDSDLVKTSDLVSFAKLALATIVEGDPDDEQTKIVINQFQMFDEGVCSDIDEFRG